MSTNASLSSKLSIEPAGNSLNLERMSSGHATYGDLVDAFARELSTEEILLISGASKSGGSYSGTSYS
ncbi:hypothetical protein [Pseudomonas peli]|uniref:hypothetical protein n=1 Tax=Pseudomonas peli TaxID=592361 RepID=UPI0024AE2F47|nr:hypothetical protein [Pseudomonas peli]